MSNVDFYFLSFIQKCFRWHFVEIRGWSSLCSPLWCSNAPFFKVQVAVTVFLFVTVPGEKHHLQLRKEELPNWSTARVVSFTARHSESSRGSCSVEKHQHMPIKELIFPLWWPEKKWVKHFLCWQWFCVWTSTVSLRCELLAVKTAGSRYRSRSPVASDWTRTFSHWSIQWICPVLVGLKDIKTNKPDPEGSS